MDELVTERRKDALWIRLNRPERLNAYDEAMARALCAAVDGAASASAVVITGTGRGFCAGGYLADLERLDPLEIRRLYRASLDLFEAIRLCPAPVIAAVNGVAAGGGNELVVACDIAIAAQSATFGQTGPKVGSSPVLGGANFLAMATGEKRAKEVAFFCRQYPASEAQAMGWINAVVPDGELEDEVARWCDELAAMSPRYLEMTKLSSNVWWNLCRDAYVQGTGMLIQAIGSHDMLEGASAFMEKRKPRFQPRAATGGRDGDHGAEADGAR